MPSAALGICATLESSGYRKQHAPTSFTAPPRPLCNPSKRQAGSPPEIHRDKKARCLNREGGEDRKQLGQDEVNEQPR